MKSRYAALAVLLIALVSAIAAPGRAAVPRRMPNQAHRWVHRADLDGDGQPDRIVITSAPDFHRQAGYVKGNVVVAAHLTSTGGVVRRRIHVGSFGGKRWSPWFGTTDIDHVGGNEIVLRAIGAADAALYRVLAYSNGALVALPPPPRAGYDPEGNKWVIVGSIIHSSGYRCTARGVVSRSFAATDRHARHYRIQRDWYAWQNGGWKHLRRRVTHLYAKHAANPTGHGVRRFGSFDCPGLPSY